jgi:hypothetical protein
MADESVTQRIESLVAEEHALRSREEGDASDVDALTTDKSRLDAIQVELDQCWDLLRQRRARRAAGTDPDTAAARDADTVEGFLQ